jgi:hypothetical protein
MRIPMLAAMLVILSLENKAAAPLMRIPMLAAMPASDQLVD